MSDLISRQAAIDALSDIEVSKMEHCVGFDRKKIYRRGKMAYFKPYRNYYDAGYSRRQIYLELQRANRTACKPCLSDGELQLITESISRYTR
jgi:hypothetical protein